MIRGHAELMQMTLASDPRVGEYLDPILRNCMILQSRLEHLMAAVRTGPASPSLVEVAPVVRGQRADDLFARGSTPAARR